jgi:orotidine-5'-phosphate decarboxylase
VFKEDIAYMIDKLVGKIKKLNAPIVVGLDPNLAFVPEHIQKKAFDEYGETLEGSSTRQL